jgi:putative transposase
MATPAEHYEPSPRKLPRTLPEPDYPSHFETLVVYPNGVISFDGIQWYLSVCLKGQLVGIEPVDDGCFKVYFGDAELGILDFRAHERRGYRCFGTLLRTDGERTSRRRRRPRRR